MCIRDRALRWHAKAGVEPRRVDQLAEQPEKAEGGGEHENDALDDMAAPEVPEFVRQHGFDLRWREACEQGVEEDDALVVAEAGEIGIAVARACLLYTSPSPRDRTRSRMPSSA